MSGYQPNPIDTAEIPLPESLTELTEQLAQQVHEVWAKGRMEQGWRYGEMRDDAKMTTPCLVPYDALPDSEREYDRKTAIETVKLLLALGYRIEKE